MSQHLCGPADPGKSRMCGGDCKTVPIIAMTADAFEEEKKKTLEAGMNYHLSTPINPKTLYNILSNHLNGKEA